MEITREIDLPLSVSGEGYITHPRFIAKGDIVPGEKTPRKQDTFHFFFETHKTDDFGKRYDIGLNAEEKGSIARKHFGIMPEETLIRISAYLRQTETNQHVRLIVSHMVKINREQKTYVLKAKPDVETVGVK